MRALAAALVVLAALAGCSGDKPHAALAAVTCPDGSVMDPEAQEGHHGEGFDPAAACPRPPTVALEGLASAVTAFVPVEVAWSVDAGDAATKHTMDTQVRVARSSAPASDADGPDAYGSELAQREHQDIPEPTLFTVEHAFEEPGVYYLRAYAQVSGKNWWSDEQVVNVSLAPATGDVVEVTKAPGAVAGDFGPAESELDLGDAVRVRNTDVVAHTYVWAEQPPAAGLEGFEVAALEGVSEDIVLVVPGVYVLQEEAPAQAKSVTFRVAAA